MAIDDKKAFDLPRDSFSFGIRNSYDDFGIKVIVSENFAPQKRYRSQVIPFKDGEYDFGRKFYQNRIVTLDCATERDQYTKAEMREIIFWLSQRSTLRIWDEPEKYYIGELMEDPSMIVYQNHVRNKFVLPFVCEPFAYGPQLAKRVTQGIQEIDYGGTAETPTAIYLKNNSSVPIVGVTLTLVSHIRPI